MAAPGALRDVAIVGFSQTTAVRRDPLRNDTEMLMEVVSGAFAHAGIAARRADVTYSGSSDYLSGMPFSFVFALDALGGWPPLRESHVEMDGAFALYEAWTRLQHGDLDTALVYSFGKSSPGDLGDVLSLQSDPYYVGPLWADPVSLAAMQARALIEAGGATEERMAAIAARCRRSAKDNPRAQVKGDFDVAALLAEPYVASPLRRHDLPPITDGAAAVILAAGDTARDLCAMAGRTPAWIRGMDHRIEAHAPGVRDLSRSTSTRLAGERAAAQAGFTAAEVQVAELHAPYTHQEIMLASALGLPDSVLVNPSGGPLAANAIMVAGLIRFGEAAARLHDRRARRAVAHATSGVTMQQNLVCLLEGA